MWLWHIIIHHERLKSDWVQNRDLLLNYRNFPQNLYTFHFLSMISEKFRRKHHRNEVTVTELSSWAADPNITYYFIYIVTI
jgi:hypothetical protein